MVEFIYIGISLWFWFLPHEPIGYALGMVLFLYFGIVVVVDMEQRVILHQISILGLILSLGTGWHLHGIVPTILGGVVGFGCMLVLHYLGNFYTHWLARQWKEPQTEKALGFGDVNLSGVLGLLLGWPGIIAGLLLAIMLGGIVSLIYVIGLVLTHRYKAFTTIPYGPFLVASAAILLFLKDSFNLIFP